MPRESNVYPASRQSRTAPSRLVLLFAILSAHGAHFCPAAEATNMETLEEVKNRLAIETAEAYRASPYSFLSKDYFARFNRDPSARATDGEVLLGPNWRIIVSADAQPLTETMASHLAEFLSQRMGIDLSLEKLAPGNREGGVEAAIVVQFAADV